MNAMIFIAEPHLGHLVKLTCLAAACLKYACEVVCLRHKLRNAPFVIIGLGKLGGGELIYGSDPDVIFVADSKVRALSKLHPLAIEILDLLSSSTELGAAYKTDTRLRPDGEKSVDLLRNSRPWSEGRCFALRVAAESVDCLLVVVQCNSGDAYVAIAVWQA